jgi:hypothetical protein
LLKPGFKLGYKELILYLCHMDTTKIVEFKKELKALLEKYNAVIGCDIDGDTHGLIEKMVVEIDRKDHTLVNGCYLDAHDLK